MDAAPPLSGVLVVSLEQAVSAPFCTRTLADLGARVLKIETPGAGDFTRDFDSVVNGMSAHFTWANRTKESVALDLKSETGLEVLRALVARADVFVQNLAPGAAARLGLGSAQLRAQHPSLVTVDISGYGEGGPFSHLRAYDLLVQSEGGSCSVTGTWDAPAKPGIPVADIGTGVQAAIAVLGALIKRRETGEGCAISVSMFDVVTDWLGWALNQARWGGTDLVPCGVGSPMVAPYGAYRTADDQVLVLGTTNDREWQRLATEVLRRPDLAADPRYATNSDRTACREELDAVIAAWAAAVTLADGRAAAQQAGIGHARLNRPTEVVEHPQLVERGRWVEVGSPVGGVPTLRPPADTDGWDYALGPIPGVGEHTEAVLRELGLDPSA